jgi:hypothetical protein
VGWRRASVVVTSRSNTPMKARRAASSQQLERRASYTPARARCAALQTVVWRERGTVNHPSSRVVVWRIVFFGGER